MTDSDLLRRYVEDADESAFAQVVRRHVHWVNSMARRMVREDSLAADVSQAVFVLLARRSRSLAGLPFLSSWLFKVTHYTALNALRMEARRRRHERMAAAMQAHIRSNIDMAQWDDLSSVLDEVVGNLSRPDREAVLLRYYEQKSFGEIGNALRISEEAARKRVSRALNELRDIFARRGIVMPAGALGVMMTSQMNQSASAALIGSATAAGQGGAAVGTVGSLVQLSGTWLTWMGLKPVVAALVGLIVLGTTSALVLQATLQSPPATAPAQVNAGQGPLGLILTPDDRPLPGARVHLIEHDGYDKLRTADSATTDARGMFTFANVIPAEEMMNNMLVQAPGYGLTLARIGGNGEDPRETLLRPATDVRIRFLGPDGQPLQGLRVLVERIQEKRIGDVGVLSHELRDQLAQTTDEDGECVFRGMPQDSIIVLDVPDERFARLMHEDRIETEDSAMTNAGSIRLQPAGSISGRLFYREGGGPLPGMSVHAEQVDRQAVTRGWGHASTGADGRFRITRLAAGDYNMGVRLSADVLSFHAAAMRTSVTVTPGADTSDQDFVLIPGAVIRGTVLAKGSRRPLANMSVGVYSPEPAKGWLSGAATKEDGRYMLHVPPGPQHVYIAQTPPPGLLEAQPKSYDITLEDGETRTIDFELPEDPARGVSGVVIDTDGKPVAGASVVAFRPDERFIYGRTHARSMVDGSFLLPAVPSGSVIRASRGRWISTDRIDVNDEHRTLEIVLHKDALASLLVNVLLPDGSAAVGVKVDMVEMQGEFGLGTESKRTGLEGTALFKNLLPDKQYRFSASGAGYGTGDAPEVQLQAGKRSETTIRVSRADSFISGRVVDRNGRPLSDIQVRAGGKVSRSQTTRTDEAGRFSFIDIVPGDAISVSTRLGDGYGRSIPIAAGTRDAMITHPPVNEP